jgi:hypothetical protein
MMLLRFSEAILSFGVFHTKLSHRHAYVVEEHSRRTAALVVNYSRRFYESLRSIETLCSISWRTTNSEKGKLENRGDVWRVHIDPSIAGVYSISGRNWLLKSLIWQMV